MNVAVFDPTVQDDKSKFRGIGRYLQILRENFKDEFKFISNIGHWKLFTLSHVEGGIGNSVFINPFFNLLQPPLTMFRIAKKQIAVIHDLIPLKYPEHFPVGLKGKLNIFLNKLALRNYDVIITDSEVSKRDIVNILGLHENKVKVVYPCLPGCFSKSNIQCPKPNVQYSISNNQFSKKTSDCLEIGNCYLFGDWKLAIGSIGNSYCIYVGDATWNKNLVNIARAIKLADVPCVFVGNVFGKAKHVDLSKWHARQPTIEESTKPTSLLHLREDICERTVNVWQKELQEFLTLAKDDKRFIFPGFISDDELIQLYEQAGLNILLSHDEGFGFSYVEAASLGCPSLLSDRPIFHEIAGTAAEFVDPENAKVIAEAIKQCINDPGKRKQLGSKAQEQSKLYSQEQFKKAFLRAII